MINRSRWLKLGEFRHPLGAHYCCDVNPGAGTVIAEHHAISLYRAREEQERINERMNATIDRSSISPVGSMPDSSDEEETTEAAGEVVWEGVKDGKLL